MCLTIQHEELFLGEFIGYKVYKKTSDEGVYISSDLHDRCPKKYRRGVKYSDEYGYPLKDGNLKEYQTGFHIFTQLVHAQDYILPTDRDEVICKVKFDAVVTHGTIIFRSTALNVVVARKITILEEIPD
jgi:hypothetical protein